MLGHTLRFLEEQLSNAKTSSEGRRMKPAGPKHHRLFITKENTRVCCECSLYSLLPAQAWVFGQSTWTIDSAHSAAQFSVRHMMVSNVPANSES